MVLVGIEPERQLPREQAVGEERPLRPLGHVRGERGLEPVVVHVRLDPDPGQERLAEVVLDAHRDRLADVDVRRRGRGLVADPAHLRQVDQRRQEQLDHDHAVERARVRVADRLAHHLGVRYRDDRVVAGADPRRTQPDPDHLAVVAGDVDQVADLERPVQHDDQPAEDVLEHVLRGEADADARGGREREQRLARGVDDAEHDEVRRDQPERHARDRQELHHEEPVPRQPRGDHASQQRGELDGVVRRDEERQHEDDLAGRDQVLDPLDLVANRAECGRVGGRGDRVGRLGERIGGGRRRVHGRGLRRRGGSGLRECYHGERPGSG